jgi:hypothetical protein
MNKKNTIKPPHPLLRSKSKKYYPSQNHHQSKTFNNPSLLDKPKRIFKQELEKSDVIEGLARIIYDYVQKYEHQLLKSRNPHYSGPRLFNSPVVSESPCLMQIQSFIQSIFDKRYMLHVESGIIALILLNRTNIKIHSQNWMRMILISLLLANKHCEDVYSVYNAKYVGLIPNLENMEINILELEFLKFLKYRLHIETETYNQYYAKLQEFFPIEEEQEDLVDDSEVMISEEEQMMPIEEELVQSMSSEMEHESKEACCYGQGQYMSNSCSNSWQDYNFDLDNNSIA